MTPVTEAVWQRIRLLFPRDQWERVEAMLADRCGADLPLVKHMGDDPAHFDRLRLAVLKLSGGTLEGLERELEGARYDWRDTLVLAGFGHDVTAHERWWPEPRD